MHQAFGPRTAFSCSNAQAQPTWPRPFPLEGWRLQLPTEQPQASSDLYSFPQTTSRAALLPTARIAPGGPQAMAIRCFCFSDGSLTLLASPSALSRRTHCQVMSNCHHSKPCRALRSRTHNNTCYCQRQQMHHSVHRPLSQTSSCPVRCLNNLAHGARAVPLHRISHFYLIRGVCRCTDRS